VGDVHRNRVAAAPGGIALSVAISKRARPVLRRGARAGSA
jgi:hypothetical protein